MNDGSYLQVQDQIPVSTVPSSSQNPISASTGQAILNILNKLDASNHELSRRMDRFERGSVSSTSIMSPTIPMVNHHKRATVTQPVAVNAQPILRRVNTGEAAGHGLNVVPSCITAMTNEARDAVVPRADVLRSIPSISTAVSQLLGNI